MNEIKRLQVELKLVGKKYADCSDLQNAFGTKAHLCQGPVQCYLEKSGDILFLCETHKSLKRMEFKLIRSVKDLRGSTLWVLTITQEISSILSLASLTKRKKNS